MKKLVFVSNFLNIHQLPLAKEFVKIFGDDYMFVAMTPVSKDHLEFTGYDMNNEPFVLRAYENSEAYSDAMRIIDEADCVISGGMKESIGHVNNRLAQNKLTFLYSERIFKGQGGGDNRCIALYEAQFL